jgi:hypothetical protein
MRSVGLLGENHEFWRRCPWRRPWTSGIRQAPPDISANSGIQRHSWRASARQGCGFRRIRGAVARAQRPGAVCEGPIAQVNRRLRRARARRATPLHPMSRQGIPAGHGGRRQDRLPKSGTATLGIGQNGQAQADVVARQCTDLRVCVELRGFETPDPLDANSRRRGRSRSLGQVIG